MYVCMYVYISFKPIVLQTYYTHYFSSNHNTFLSDTCEIPTQLPNIKFF